MYSQLRRKNSSKLMEEFEGPGYKGLTVRNLLVGGALLAILIWGSSFLLYTINALQSRNLTDAEISQYLKAKAPPLLYGNDDGRRNMDFGGKIQLDFDAVRDDKFVPEVKSVQWIKEPLSIENDKGTFLVKEVDSQDKDKIKYVIRSIVDETYEHTLYDGKFFEYGSKQYEIEDLVASPDLNKAIIRTNGIHNWRYSKFSIYWILDITTHEIVPLVDVSTKVSAANWSPLSTHIAFILDNNVYIRSLVTGETEQATFDGSAQVFNGRPDWVYEEEVFGQEMVLWWSHAGDKIAYLKLNDTDVPEYQLESFVDEDGYPDYPTVNNIKYPKAGHTNPIVNVVVFEIGNNAKEQVLDFQSEKIKIEDRVVTGVSWINQSLLVTTSNRASTLLETYLLEGKLAQLLRTETFDKGWFETNEIVYVPRDPSKGREHDGYLDTVLVDGYSHLAYFSPPSNPVPHILTKGAFEVIRISSVNLNTNEVYFSSTAQGPINRSIQAVNLFKSGIKTINQGEGVFGGSFSSGSRYLLLSYSGPHVPYQKLIDLSNGRVIRTLEDNQKLKDTLTKYAIPERVFGTTKFKDAESGETLEAVSVETLPLNFDPKRKYPVLFYVYGGPGSQAASKAFRVNYDQVVASQLDAIVVTVDGRGTAYNTFNKIGSQYKFIVRDRLGYYEARDQIAAAKVYAQKPYVDSSRIAIWGWSYGGYLTLKTLETDAEDSVFLFGASVAPVTNWKLYDSIYTERYMRTPQENKGGYEESAIHKAENFKHVKKFFVAHGTDDDNVHIQNTYHLLDRFNQASVENFELMIFPGSDHGIKFHNGNPVIYDRMLDFFKRAFRGDFN